VVEGNDLNEPIYGLTRLDPFFRGFVKTSRQQHEKTRVAKSFLLTYLGIERNYDIFIENYYEFECAMNEATTRSMIYRSYDFNSFQNTINTFNRTISNVIASGRAYVDMTKKSISTLSKIDDVISLDYILELKSIYEASIGYRVMDALRNYSLHHEFPVHYLTLGSEWIGDETDEKLRFSISPYVQTERLLRDKNFKRSVAKELSNIGDKIELKYLVRDYVEHISNFHFFIRDGLTDRIIQHEINYCDMHNIYGSHFPNTEHSAPLASVLQECPSQYADVIEIQKEFSDYRRYFFSKHKKLTNLKCRYISSEVIDKG